MRSPFAEALGASAERLAPGVREHFAPQPGMALYQGVMRRVWRPTGVRRWLSAPFLWLGSRLHTLFPETGEQIPFSIVNRFYSGPDGIKRMTFERSFSFPKRVRRFEATMYFDTQNKVVLDILGPDGYLLVELIPEVDGDAITIRTGRQWLLPFGLPLRIPLPAALAGEARIREWQVSDNEFGIKVTISNPILKEFFGYEGTFGRVEAPADKVEKQSARPWWQLTWFQRFSMAAVAIAGTALYVFSFTFGSNQEMLWGLTTQLGIAAGLSWVGLGAALLAVGHRTSIWNWIDVCLRTMTLGIGVLSIAILLNAVSGIFGLGVSWSAVSALHIAILILSDVLMGAYFSGQALRSGLAIRMALTLWLFVLNGMFLFLVWLL